MTTTCYQNGEYLAKHPNWHEEDSDWKANQVCRMLAKNHLQPSTFCEIGCGAGGVLTALQRRHGGTERFWGYEVSPQAFNLCRAKANDRLSFVLGDLCAEPPESPFDLIMALDVMEHVENPLQFLRQIRPLAFAKIFHIPLDLSVQSIVRNVPAKVRDSAGHLHYYTRELALLTLRDAGYQVVDYFYTPAALENGSPTIKTRLMRLPRKLMFSVHPHATATWLGGFSLLVLAI